MDDYRKEQWDATELDPDKHLLKKLRRDPDLFALVYQKHQDYVYRYLFGRCRDADMAEDLTGDTFEAAYRALKNFRQKSSMRSWLISIARNKFIDFLRKRSGETLVHEDAEAVGSGHRFPDEDLIALVDLLDQLPAEYSEVIKLRILADLPHHEIGEILGKKSNSVRTLYRRAIESLMRYLNNEGKGTYETGG